jgi:hypothetical protein
MATLGGVSLMDFSAIGDIPKTIREGRKGRREEEIAEKRKVTLAELGSGASVGDVARKLFQAGDIEGGLSLAQLGNAQAQQEWNRTYQGGMLDIARQTASRKEAPTIGEVYDEDTGQPRKVAVTGSGMVPVGGVKKVEPKSKDLPFGVVKELGERGGTYGDFVRLTDGFNDSFGGYRSETVGDVANLAARNLGIGNKEGATWWQDYQGRKNLVRNQLFGSALTATEKAEFDKANINPGMTPDAIRKNLELQKAATQKAAAKMAGAYAKMGYSAEQIEAALGIPLADLGIAPPAPKGGAKPAAPAARAGTRPAADPLAAARSAIDQGADKNAVIQRLRENGIDPSGL